METLYHFKDLLLCMFKATLNSKRGSQTMLPPISPEVPPRLARNLHQEFRILLGSSLPTSTLMIQSHNIQSLEVIIGTTLSIL